MLLVVTAEQCVVALVIAWLADRPDPQVGALFVAVLASGIGQAFYAPTYSALVPTLVERKDLTGAVSLNSANMNLSRVIGPAIGGVLYAKVGAPWAFVGNSISYLALLVRAGHRPAPPFHATIQKGWRRLLDGFVIARRDRVVGRCLTTMMLFSFFCLPIASPDAGAGPQRPRHRAGTIAYGLLYACFGAGAVVGALVHRHLPRRTGNWRCGPFRARWFRCALAVFGLLRVRPDRHIRSPSSSDCSTSPPSPRWPRCSRSDWTTRCAAGSWPCGPWPSAAPCPRRHRRRSAQWAVRHLRGGSGRRGGGRRSGPLRRSTRPPAPQHRARRRRGGPVKPERRPVSARSAPAHSRDDRSATARPAACCPRCSC